MAVTKQNSNEPSTPLANVLYHEVGVSNVQRANTFIPTEDYSLEYIVAKVSEFFQDTCVNIIAEIFSVDGSRKPTGSALASVTVLQELIPTSATEVTFTFASPLAVTNGVEYCLLLRSDADVTTTARWWYGFSNTGISWATSDGGSVWSGGSAIPGFWFQIWGGPVFNPPATNLTTLKRLVAVANDKVFYET